jgi:hypothetical protein
VNVKKILGFLAIGGLLAVAVPAERAQALSLASPGTAAAVQDDSGKADHRGALASSRLAPALGLAPPSLASPALAPLVTASPKSQHRTGPPCGPVLLWADLRY